MQSEENHTPKQFLEATGRYFTHVTSRDVPWEILNHGGLSPEICQKKLLFCVLDTHIE